MKECPSAKDCVLRTVCGIYFNREERPPCSASTNSAIRPINHDGTDNIICPCCGHNESESWERQEDQGEDQCEQCGARFSYRRDVSVTYTTVAIREGIKNLSAIHTEIANLICERDEGRLSYSDLVIKIEECLKRAI
jgi:hypothetical protein